MVPSGRVERRTNTRRRVGALGVAGLAVLALGACSVVDAPVRWYRDATGLSKNDQMGQDSNQKNLEAGTKEPYPNLAEVPQPPNRAMSAMDREALRQSLAADRQNAHYTEDQLQAGSPVPGMVAPPAPAAAPPAIASPKPAPAHQAPPAESSLKSPEIASLPQGETPSAPPPAPKVEPSPPVTESPIPRAAPNPPPASANAKPSSTSAETASSTPASPAKPGSPPAAPTAAAPPPPPQIAATMPPPRPSGPPAGSNAARQVEVADVTFAPESSEVSSALNGTLAEVVAQHKARQGKLRIVGYAQKTKGATTQQDLASYNLALERAKSVAASLTKLGIAAGDIAVEASVEAAGDARAEIYMNK